MFWFLIIVIICYKVDGLGFWIIGEKNSVDSYFFK